SSGDGGDSGSGRFLDGREPSPSSPTAAAANGGAATAPERSTATERRAVEISSNAGNQQTQKLTAPAQIAAGLSGLDVDQALADIRSIRDRRTSFSELPIDRQNNVRKAEFLAQQVDRRALGEQIAKLQGIKDEASGLQRGIIDENASDTKSAKFYGNIVFGSQLLNVAADLGKASNVPTLKAFGNYWYGVQTVTKVVSGSLKANSALNRIFLSADDNTSLFPPGVITARNRNLGANATRTSFSANSNSSPSSLNETVSSNNSLPERFLNGVDTARNLGKFAEGSEKIMEGSEYLHNPGRLAKISDGRSNIENVSSMFEAASSSREAMEHITKGEYGQGLRHGLKMAKSIVEINNPVLAHKIEGISDGYEGLSEFGNQTDRLGQAEQIFRIGGGVLRFANNDLGEAAIHGSEAIATRRDLREIDELGDKIRKDSARAGSQLEERIEKYRQLEMIKALGMYDAPAVPTSNEHNE
ncbi:hypothetical protein, partial [Methylobacterium sp. D48H]